MEQLKERIDYYFINLEETNFEKHTLACEAIEEDVLVSPFTKENIKMAALLSEGVITFGEYIRLEREYGLRNKYLYTFEFSGPRTFGESWAQEYLKEQVPELEYPSKQNDSNYSGEYDFRYKDIRVEVKASRAVLDVSGGKLIDKALYSTDKESKFNMNFQQLKPACCDVFVWMGVWRDKVRFWVLSNTEVVNNSYFSSGQHRGNKGEGQLWIKQSNIDDFDIFEVEPTEILETIVQKSKA